MESLSEQLERFSQVLALSCTTHVSSWDPATVRRALQWARYLRHVHRRFGRNVRIRTALDQRLQNQWKQVGGPGSAGVLGLTNFRALERCDLRLSLRLLENPALGNAAFHSLLQYLFPGPGGLEAGQETLQDSLALLARRRSAVHMLSVSGTGETSVLREDSVTRTLAELLRERLQEVGRAEAEGACSFLSSLWERLPHDNTLQVIAAALLLSPSPPRPPEEELERGIPKTPGDGSQELVNWLLRQPDVMATFCRRLPAGLLTSVAGRHSDLFQAYLGLLTHWGEQLHYDLQKGVWVGAEPHGVPWEELRGRFQSLCEAPSPLKDAILAALEALRAQDGDFQVPGLSIWTDLLLALGTGA